MDSSTTGDWNATIQEAPMTGDNRPKRAHRDPYGPMLDTLIKEGDEALQQLGIIPEPHPEPGPYEPDYAEQYICRAALKYVSVWFGEKTLRNALLAAGIPEGVAIEDDYDLDLVSEVTEFVRQLEGEDEASKIDAFVADIRVPAQP